MGCLLRQAREYPQASAPTELRVLARRPCRRQELLVSTITWSRHSRRRRTGSGAWAVGRAHCTVRPRPESRPEEETHVQKEWPVLVVDDEPDVLELTRLVFEGCPGGRCAAEAVHGGQQS